MGNKFPRGISRGLRWLPTQLAHGGLGKGYPQKSIYPDACMAAPLKPRISELENGGQGLSPGPGAKDQGGANKPTAHINR